jgi:succinyl-CoA synthetase beta subunit
MVYYNELHPSETQHPGPFSVCVAACTEIFELVHNISNTEMTQASLLSDITRCDQLLERLENALNEVKSKFPVQSRHLWVKDEIERYEQTVKRTQIMSAKLHHFNTVF